MTITFENTPREIIDQAIYNLIVANPTITLSRAGWLEFLKEEYVIKTKETDSYNHIIFEPKDL